MEKMIANIASKFDIKLSQASIIVETAIEHLSVKHKTTIENISENVGFNLNLTKQFIDLTVIGVQSALSLNNGSH